MSRDIESAPVRRRKFFLVAREARPGSPRVTAVVTGRKTGLWSGSVATVLQKQVEFATIDLWSSSGMPTKPPRICASTRFHSLRPLPCLAISSASKVAQTSASEVCGLSSRRTADPKNGGPRYPLFRRTSLHHGGVVELGAVADGRSRRAG